MQLIAVQDRLTIRAFLDLPKSIYANDPNWICPLEKDIEFVFDPSRNSFFNHGSCRRWILVDETGKTIGRIAAFYDLRKTEQSDFPVGGCGFFECINGQEAADLLFKKAQQWLTEKGMRAMDGPINFGENVMWWGLLVEGFSRPYYGMNYHPPYYKELFEAYGFGVLYEQISNRIDTHAPFPERFTRIAQRAKSRPGVRIEHLRIRDYDKYAADFAEIYNDAWKHFENFVPVSMGTVRENFEQMKPVMDEKLVWYAYYQGEPAAFLLVLPDANDLIQGLNGKLDLLGKIRFLWNRFTRKPTRMRAVIMGTKEKYRRLGLESAIFISLKEYVDSLDRYDELELSWVGDFNVQMMSIHQATGAVFSKKHITYRRVFD